MLKPSRRRSADHPTGAQLRAARGLLNMSVLELTELTKLSINTVKRAEAVNTPAPVNAATAQLLVSSLGAAGVVFIPATDESGAGVRLRDPSPARVLHHRRRNKSVEE